MNVEPVTNEQPAQVGALSRAPAPLQQSPAPPGAMVMSKQAAGRQQAALAQLPVARTPLLYSSVLAAGSNPASPFRPSGIGSPTPLHQEDECPSDGTCWFHLCVAIPDTHGRGEEEIPAGRTFSCEEPAASCIGVRAPSNWGRCPGLSPIDTALLSCHGFHPPHPLHHSQNQTLFLCLVPILARLL